MVLMMAELDNPRVPRKYSLRDMRVDAGFFSQEALGKAAGRSKAIIWKAENHRPITRVSATMILFALRDRGYNVTINEIDWVIKPTGQPRKKK